MWKIHILLSLLNKPINALLGLGLLRESCPLAEYLFTGVFSAQLGCSTQTNSETLWVSGQGMTHGCRRDCGIAVSSAGRFVHLSSLSHTKPALTLFIHPGQCSVSGSCYTPTQDRQEWQHQVRRGEMDREGASLAPTGRDSSADTRNYTEQPKRQWPV